MTFSAGISHTCQKSPARAGLEPSPARGRRPRVGSLIGGIGGAIAMETELSFHLLRWSFQPRPVGEAERGKLLFFLPVSYLLCK